jgi:hypothetical protein
VNFHNRPAVCSVTILGYVDAVNVLFKLWGFVRPAQLSEAGNPSAILIDNLPKEEEVASQRLPLDNAVFAQL